MVSFVLVLSMAGNTSADLVAHWSLDEGSGTTVYDSSGRGNDGTLGGDPQWIVGRTGMALDFNGEGDYVDCGDSEDFQFTDQMTVACWVRSDDFGWRMFCSLVSKRA